MNPRYPLVSGRAAHRCEYCHAPEVVFNLPFEVEHIQPQSEGGINEDSNLALACRSCNLFKGVQVTGFDEVTQTTARLFDPRSDAWLDHFDVEADTGIIRGRTEIGRATAMRLRMNREVQLIARISWMELGLFP